MALNIQRVEPTLALVDDTLKKCFISSAMDTSFFPYVNTERESIDGRGYFRFSGSYFKSRNGFV